MFRALKFLVVLGVLATGTVWFADNPGAVTLQWRGYRLETSVGILLGAFLAVAVSAALVYRFWCFLRRGPKALARIRRSRRRRKGYLALTRGMVAVAAGDAEEAGRQVARAEGLLSDPPLTMLLSAQAAQLDGDDAAAAKFFTAMLEKPETEFLGLRGLLTQSMKLGDWDRAQDLARRAYALKPKSGWVASSYFDLLTRAGQWLPADKVLSESIKNKLVTGEESRRRKAVLAFQEGLDAERLGQGARALKLIRKANDLDPAFIPAAVRLSALLVEAGKVRKAASKIEDSWSRCPHPDFPAVYWLAKRAVEPMAKVRAAERLAKFNPDHPESHIAVARAALDGLLWGEARKHLEGLVGETTTMRVYRMLAELEESEHQDLARAREWLMRASSADPDPAWVCESCGDTVTEWRALCANCAGFGGYRWKTPPHAQRLESPPEAALPAHGE